MRAKPKSQSFTCSRVWLLWCNSNAWLWKYHKTAPEGRGRQRPAARSRVSGRSEQCVWCADTAEPRGSETTRRVSVKFASLSYAIQGLRDGLKWPQSSHLLTAERCHLCDQEARVAFRQSAQLAGQNHLQHVSVQPLHDDEDVLHRLEHVLQQDHAEVGQALGNAHKARSNQHDHVVNNELERK